MKINWKKLIISLFISVGTGALAGALTSGSMETYQNLVKPALSPPSAVFPIVWTALYILMGISAYLVWTSNAPQAAKENALQVYALQLALNFLWSILFFNAGACLAAFFCLLLLWVLIIIMIVSFYRICPLSAYLQIPYLLWVTFAGYLNLSICLLNR